MSIYPVPLSGTVNTLMWADETGIEEPAIRQLRNVSALPWTHGLRVMPDVHYGKGATVGSVMGSTHPRGLEMLTGATRDLSETRHVSVIGREGSVPRNSAGLRGVRWTG